MTLGTDGYMRWAWDNYVYDMHGDATYRYWDRGDGWFIYPEEREAIDESYHASFYSTPRYELFKQGIRDVAKAKYLLNSEAASIEQKTALKNVVENLKQPNKKELIRGQLFLRHRKIACLCTLKLHVHWRLRINWLEK